jgi:hypothetical protein
MRPRTLLILALAVLGLGAFIWLYERKLPGSEKRAALERRVLPDFNQEEVTAIEIEAAQGTVRLEREPAPEKPKDEAEKDDDEEKADAEEPAVWRIVRPLAARADSYAVDKLLTTVANLEKSRTLESPDPKEMGLDRPRSTIRLVTGKRTQVLRLGAQVPTEPSLIAQLEGESEAWVVSDSILSEVDRKPGDWRDHTMVHGDRDAVEQIRLTGAAGPVDLAARENGYWIEGPIRDRADRDLVSALLSDLFGLTAETFLDDPAASPESLGLTPPTQTVTVDLGGEASPIHVVLGNPREPVVPDAESLEGSPLPARLVSARVGDAVFETRTRLAEAVNRPAADWRDLRWSGLEVHQIESATVKDQAGILKLTRAETDWKRGAVTISYLPVSDLLFSLTGARASRLLTSAEAEGLGAKLDRPVLTVTLSTKEAGSETLTLYAGISEGLPAKASGREVVFLLGKELAEELEGNLRKVREAKPAEDAEDSGE